MQSESYCGNLRRPPVDEDERKWRAYGAYARLGAGLTVLALLLAAGVNSNATHHDNVAGGQMAVASPPPDGSNGGDHAEP